MHLIGADRYARLLRRRLQHRETLRKFFEGYDLLLTPTTPCVAWDIERALPPGHENAVVWSYFTYPFNLTGQPARGANLFLELADAAMPSVDSSDWRSAADRVAALVRPFEPDLALLPWRRDPACDHRDSWALARAAVGSAGCRPIVLEYAIGNGHRLRQLILNDQH